MVVRTIRARHNRKTGRVAITFEVDRETLANMRHSAQAGAHPDTLDYIAAVINTAFLDDAPPPGAGQGGEADPDWAGRTGRNPRRAHDPEQDLDDGVPF